MLSGVDELIMTKADVLTGFGDIKVCTNYFLENKEIDYIPFEFQNSVIEPKYVDCSGWEGLPDNCSKENLPVGLKDYIKFIEKSTGIPIVIASLGPDREQIVIL
jgi:adenylosuccinate synthase